MIKLTNKIYISKKAENQFQMEGESHGGNGRGMYGGMEKNKEKRKEDTHGACMYGNERECVSPMVLTKHTRRVNHSYNCVVDGTYGISLDVVETPLKIDLQRISLQRDPSKKKVYKSNLLRHFATNIIRSLAIS